MIMLSILFFTLGMIFLIFGTIQIGKKSYQVSLDIDVENIIKKEVRSFLEEHKSIHKVCNHKWKTESSGPITNSNKVAIGKYFNLQCEHCGDMMRKNLKT